MLRRSTLLIAIIFLAGCADPSAIQSSDASMGKDGGDATSHPDQAPEPAPETRPEPTTNGPERPIHEDETDDELPGPYSIHGWLIAPDPLGRLYKSCHAVYVSTGNGRPVEGIQEKTYDLPFPMDGWSFRSNNAAATLRFSNETAGLPHDGTVPQGATKVNVCNRDTVAAPFKLTFMPPHLVDALRAPGMTVLSGSLAVPEPTFRDTGACRGYGAWYPISVGQATTRVHHLDGKGHVYMVDRDGLHVQFLGGERYEAGSAGLVPAGATMAVVCATTEPADYQLIIAN